jgi:hypothetical protein
VCCRRCLQRLRILLQIVVDHRERHAPLEVGETQPSAPLCWIAIAVRYGSTRRPRVHREYGIELPKEPFDHSALMDAAAIAVANAVVLAAALESAPFELFRGVGDEQPRSSEHRPAMLDAARANQSSFGHIVCARHRATDSADGFSRVKQNPSMLRVATSATRVRYARPTKTPSPSTTSTKLMSVGV